MSEHSWGLPVQLHDPINRRRIQQGNRTARAVITFARACLEQRAPCVLEHPLRSIASKLSASVDLLARPAVVEHNMDYSACGALWRKSAKLVCIHIGMHRCLVKRCAKPWPHICKNGRYHTVLRGQTPGTGTL